MKKLKLSAKEIVNEAEKEVGKYFEKIDEICDFNQEKVLRAFQKNKIGEEHFYTVTGYGHDDPKSNSASALCIRYAHSCLCAFWHFEISGYLNVCCRQAL